MTSLKLRTRLTLWYCVVLAAVFVTFGGAVTWQQQRIGQRRVDRELENLTATLAGLLRDELSENDTPVDAAREVHHTIQTIGLHVAIALDGRLLTDDPLNDV